MAEFGADVVRPDYPGVAGRIIRFLQQFGGVLKLGFTSSVGGMAMQTSPTFSIYGGGVTAAVACIRASSSIASHIATKLRSLFVLV